MAEKPKHTFRFDDEVFEKLKRLAKKNRRSQSGQLEYLVLNEIEPDCSDLEERKNDDVLLQHG